MIIVKLMGGLGNQLFQYSLGRALSAKKKIPFKLDISWFSGQEKRQYKLNNLNISAQIASETEIDRVCNYSSNRYLRKIYGYFQQALPYYWKSWVREVPRVEKAYDKNIFRVPGNVYLEGYWQSHHYFQPIKEILKSEFEIKSALDQRNKNIMGKIESNGASSVSLHVRRSDYVNEDTALVVCSLDYYHQAIKYIEDRIPDPHFYIFSDDFDWVKSNLFTNHEVTYVDHNNLEYDYMDLMLMTRCRHHVNANSSFSWWGAWLDDREASIVIVPQRWFKERYPGRFTLDRAPENWIRMDL